MASFIFPRSLCFLSSLGCMLRLLFVYICKPSFLFSIVVVNFIVVTGREDRWYAIFGLMCELRKYSATANNIKFAKGREVFIMIYLSLIKSYRFDLMPNAGIFFVVLFFFFTLDATIYQEIWSRCLSVVDARRKICLNSKSAGPLKKNTDKSLFTIINSF